MRSPLLNDIAHSEFRRDEIFKVCRIKLFPEAVYVYGEGVFVNENVGFPEFSISFSRLTILPLFSIRH